MAAEPQYDRLARCQGSVGHLGSRTIGIFLHGMPVGPEPWQKACVVIGFRSRMSAPRVLAEGAFPPRPPVGSAQGSRITRSLPSTRSEARIVAQVNEPDGIEEMLWQWLRSASFQEIRALDFLF